MKLFLASIFTLLLLSSFVFAILFAFLYLTGAISLFWMFGLTILFNFFMWLFGPWISDWIYRFFYKVQWISIDDLKKISPSSADLLVRTCAKYRFNLPKLGLIPDKNPNAFTYGSGRWNGRIIITQGILEYLDENERASVYAHELGHIKNRDFIIMTIAATLLQLLYELYWFFRAAVKARTHGRKGGQAKLVFLVFMIISYIFYWISQYVVLYLSRLREYYADEFAARETDANHLSSALIKIAYGILINPDDIRLVNSTKYIGIMDFKLTQNIGLVYYNCKKLKNFDALNKALLYDVKTPWGFLTELKSTHPLTGKRIRRLATLTNKPLFNLAEIERKYPVDMGRLYKNFLIDVSALFLPLIFMVFFPLIYGALFFMGLFPLYFNVLIGGWLFLIGVGIIIFTLYKYPDKEPEKATVIDLMSDIYASPVKGKMVKMEGKLIGRGIPGLIFSEDMMMQDKTGLMFLNYENWFPLIGNLLFGLSKVPKLIGKNAEITGWFLRGAYHLVAMKSLKTGGEQISSYMRLGGFIGAGFFFFIGLVAFSVILPGFSLTPVASPTDCGKLTEVSCMEYWQPEILQMYTNRDACYTYFAINNKDVSLCEKQTGNCTRGGAYSWDREVILNKESCYYKVAIASGDVSLCREIVKSSGAKFIADKCIEKIAVAKKDPQICGFSSTLNSCITEVAVATCNKDLCYHAVGTGADACTYSVEREC